jgi:hypothetical protein
MSQLPERYYSVSYKTFFHERIKPVIFQGRETQPLYLQVTFDRKTTLFKSYYFDVFSQPKYDFLGITLSQIEEMEMRAIEATLRHYERLSSVTDLVQAYKVLCVDLLDLYDGHFKVWLADRFLEEGLPGLAALVRRDPESVMGIQLWDDLKKCLDPELFARLERKGIHKGETPYLCLAIYVRGKTPDKPFYLPLHEWKSDKKQVEIEFYLDGLYGSVDMGRVIRELGPLFKPGFRFHRL